MKRPILNILNDSMEFLVTSATGLPSMISGAPEPSDSPFVAVPGLVDLQVNGYMGRDYSSPVLTEQDVVEICRDMVQIGTLFHVPTIITRPQHLIVRSLRLMEEVRKRESMVKHGIIGYHIEGPYISAEEGPRGAHDPAYIRNPSYEEFLEWQSASNGRVRIVTLAPELPGALSFIERITADGVTASIGHSAAEPELIRRAVNAGARMSTHLGNGSHRFLPRLDNYLWEQIACDELDAGLIADGYHLPAAALRTIARTKGTERIVLVSDLSPMAGLEPGTYEWDRIQVKVRENGMIEVDDGPYFAGAWRSLLENLSVFCRAAGTHYTDTIRLASLRPIRLLGLESWYRKRMDKGTMTVLKWDEAQQKLQAVLSSLEGRIIHHNNDLLPLSL